MTKQFELAFDPASFVRPLPEILTLEEFVEQMEREYGPSAKLDTIRAALVEPQES